MVEHCSPITLSTYWTHHVGLDTDVEDVSRLRPTKRKWHSLKLRLVGGDGTSLGVSYRAAMAIPWALRPLIGRASAQES
jgi:hypothetical protein